MNLVFSTYSVYKFVRDSLFFSLKTHPFFFRSCSPVHHIDTTDAGSEFSLGLVFVSHPITSQE